MNRRDFIIHACKFAAAFGLGGRLINESLKMTIAKPNSRHSIISESDGKKLINELEKIGLPPREAMYWEKTSDGQIKCLLCPKFCILSNYERGQCRARISLGNRLATLVYGKPCSVAIDPIEKKPVFHMLPGTTSFSIATAGCVLGCRYCQNWQISQAKPE
ncbi:hypothetical protein HYY75_07615, partial [bacterium]|nr:hypothetical protein [bacterium]